MVDRLLNYTPDGK